MSVEDVKIQKVVDALDRKEHSKEVLVLLKECENWAKKNIHEVVCSYSGSGDSGSIDSFEADGLTIREEELGEGIEEAFSALTWNIADYNGDGGGGSIIVNVDKYTVTRWEYSYERTTNDFPPEEL